MLLIIILIILNNQIKLVIFVLTCLTRNKWIMLEFANIDTFIIRVGFRLTNVDTIRTLTRPINMIATPNFDDKNLNNARMDYVLLKNPKVAFTLPALKTIINFRYAS